MIHFISSPNKNKKPLVFIHGIASTSEIFIKQVIKVNVKPFYKVLDNCVFVLFRCYLSFLVKYVFGQYNY